MIKRLLHTSLFIGLLSHLNAQDFDEKNFVHYTAKDGLSNNTVNSVVQDQYGYIWIATNKGLNRFDGNSFQQFYSDSSHNSLPVDFVHKLKWLDKEQLAALTNTGLHIINTRTLGRRNLYIPPDSLKVFISVNRVLDAFLDTKGNIFLASGTGFYQFNDKNDLVFRYDYYSSKYLVDKKPAAFGINIISLEENILLLTTFKGPYLYNIAKRDLHPIGDYDDAFYRLIGRPKTTLSITHHDENSFSTLSLESDEFAWFDLKRKTKHIINLPFQLSGNIIGGTAGKVVRLNDSVFAINRAIGGFYLGRNSGEYILYPQVNFEKYYCHSFLIDKNNRLWVGTSNGLYRQKRSAAIVERFTTSLSYEGFTNEIHSIAVSNNKVFVGTIAQGMMVFDRDSLKLLRRIELSQYKRQVAAPNFVYAIIPVHKDTLYTSVAGLWINTRDLTHKSLPLSRIDTTYDGIDVMFRDSRNIIYLKKGNPNIFYVKRPNEHFRIVDYRNELSTIGNDINSIAEDPTGNIWFIGSGMMRFNTGLQKFDLILDSFPSLKVPRKGITSNLVFDQSGNLYFGLYDNGLIIYEIDKKKFTQVTRSEGLPDNTIRAICLHKNKLWMATESGLANYDIATKRVSSFGIAEDIPTEPHFLFSLYYDSTNQHLYGAFKNTIFRFDPDKLTKSNAPPAFLIASAVIAGKETTYHPGDKIVLSYKQNNVVINLSSINFEDAYQQQFAYRVAGDANNPWIETGTQRSVIFSNLSPGNHRLQFKVYTRNQSWPDQIKEITVVIRPPFWKTIWFYFIVAIVIAVFLYYLHRRRIRHVMQKANIDKQLAQTEMKALHAQMNPHFIFNCLNSIREMILNNENEQASLYLSKFARLIRITLNQSSKQFVSLTDTIDYLERYIEMEKIRSGHFNYTTEVAKDLNPDDIMVPPMLIQPFIENAIWHGAPPKKSMDIHTSFRKKGNELVCVVEDNGIGIEESMRKKENIPNQPSVGIVNIRQRIDLLNEKYDLKSTIKIEDKSASIPGNGTGTLVTLHLPIKINESLLTG